MPGDSSGEKPDLVVIDRARKKAIVVDVTVPLEVHVDSLQDARERKEGKLQTQRAVLENQGFDVSCGAFVVGSLGSWDPKNADVLGALHIGRRYAVLFRKLCCSDAISGSYDIWRAHCRR